MTALQARIKMLPWDVAVNVYKAGTPEEQQNIHDMVESKVQNAKKKGTISADKVSEIESLGLNTDKSLADQVRTGKITKAQAADQLREQYKNGEINPQQWKNQLQSLGKDAIEAKAMTLDTSTDNDFEKLKDFLKTVPDEQRNKVRLIMLKKLNDKREHETGKDGDKPLSPKTRKDINTTMQILNEWNGGRP